MQVIGRQSCRLPDGDRVQYERHRPEQTTLYRLVQAHAATFSPRSKPQRRPVFPSSSRTSSKHSSNAASWPTVSCTCAAATVGTTSWWRSRANGAAFARIAAPVGWRTRRRTWSITSLRPVPVRLWVLSLPIPLVLLLAAQPQLLTPVLQVVHRVLNRFRLDQSGLTADQADSGADGEPVFVGLPAPTDEVVRAVLHKIITRMMKLLTRQGVLLEEQGQTYLAGDDASDDSDESRALRRLQAAAPSAADFKRSLCADPGRLQPARGGALRGPRAQVPGATVPLHHRPAIANERVMSPLVFVQRLAALVPRPRLHLIRFGVRPGLAAAGG